MERIGIFLCHCSLLRPIDIQRVLGAISEKPGVVYAAPHQDMCTDPGLALVKNTVKGEKLDGVVLTSCSPSLHGEVFRDALASVGLASHQLEIADLKGQDGIEEATEQAIEAITRAVERLRISLPTITSKVPITKRALVIGGGVAGIRAALDIADSGYEVILVERTSSIGGHMIQLSETFPTLDCPQCIETPWMVDCGQHPNIKIMAYSEVEAVSGEIGNFRVSIRRKASYVDWDKCTGCEECTKVCPVEWYAPFERGVAPMKAIYKPFPQAVPNKAVIEKRGIAPCRAACPAGVNGQGYVALISQGKFKEALHLIQNALPFPSICGRACHHPCEDKCNRKEVDEPVAIRPLKRFVADWAAQLEEGQPEALAPTREERVAIVGAGPAGLTCALRLLEKGYPVTVFEASDKPGGMMVSCIQDYRIPREIANRDINALLSRGIQVRTNTKIGRDITLAELGKEYKAIFIGIGVQEPRKLPLDGVDTKGVLYGLPFLREVKERGKAEDLGERVIVIGGGNVAIDCAKSALRVGANEVHIVCLETRDLTSRDRMPAHDWEIEEVEEEGAIIHGSLGPKKIVSEGGRVAGLETVVCTSVYEEDGRFAPKFAEGAAPTIRGDTIIIAIGQAPDFTGFEDLEKTPRQTLKVDEVTLETSIPGVFSGGDIVRGPASVVEAVAHGNEAAISIDRFLNGVDLKEGRERKVEVAPLPEGKIEGKERVKVSKRDAQERIKGFDEIEFGLSEDAAIEEAKRCLNCAFCSECLECIKLCEAKAIDHEIVDRYEEVEVGAIVVATGYELLPKGEIREFEEDPDILDGLQFERILCPSGPTNGAILRPSDGKVAKEVVFISCVGSRDPEHGLPYCSRVCCMYLVKMAMLYKHAVHDGQAYIFYTDIRVTGKGYEEFVQRAVEENGVLYLRGRVSKVFRDGDKIRVWGVDTLTGKRVEISCDLVVLAMAMIAGPEAKDLAQKLGITTDEYGFMAEIHPKLRPVESVVPGIYLAGTAQSPKDIPDAVAQASGAASKVLALFSKDELILEKVAAS